VQCSAVYDPSSGEPKLEPAVDGGPGVDPDHTDAEAAHLAECELGQGESAFISSYFR
jgi:hypothetical protein